jgi:HK97 family phage major capsid protein
MHTERLSELTARYELLAAMDRRKRELEATTDAVRFLATKADAGMTTNAAALGLFFERFPRSPFTLSQKAAVPPVTTVDGGAALLPPSMDPIIALVQKEILPARLNLPKVPFNVPVPSQASLGTYAWVIEGQPKPVSRITWTPVTNPAGKIAGIVPLSKELVRLTPGAEGIMATALVGGAVKFSDEQFLDPAVAGVLPNGSPASITNGVTPITASGTTLAARVDELIAALYANRPETSRPAIIATAEVAQQLARTAGAAGDTGTFGVVPVFASPAAGGLVIALDRDAVTYSDGGGSVDTSEEAAISMDDAPGAPTAATVVTSLWQQNLVAFRVERMLWWQKVEANAVQVLEVTP